MAAVCVMVQKFKFVKMVQQLLLVQLQQALQRQQPLRQLLRQPLQQPLQQLQLLDRADSKALAILPKVSTTESMKF